MRTAAAPTLAVAAVASTLASARQVSAVQRLVSGLTLTLLLATPARAGWVSHGPEGGVTPALAVDATTNRSTVYAGPSGGGVFKTTNGGGSWSAVNTGLAASFVLALAVDATPSPTSPSTVYAGTDSRGVFKTTNGGGSWSAVNTGLPNHVGGAHAVAAATCPRTMESGAWGDEVGRRRMGGGGW